MDEHWEMLARIETEKENDGNNPRSIAQIRRANVPNTSEPNMGEGNLSTVSTGAILEVTKNSHPTSLDCLCLSEERSSEINIICSWTTTGNQNFLVGQHHLRQLAVRPEFKSKGCPVLISAKYDAAFTHDFSGGPLVSFWQFLNMKLLSIFKLVS